MSHVAFRVECCCGRIASIDGTNITAGIIRLIEDGWVFCADSDWCPDHRDTPNADRLAVKEKYPDE